MAQIIMDLWKKSFNMRLPKASQIVTTSLNNIPKTTNTAVR